MEGDISNKFKNHLLRFFANSSELETFLREHAEANKDELFRLASAGKGKAKSHISGMDEGELKLGHGVGISNRKNRMPHSKPFKLNLPPQ